MVVKELIQILETFDLGLPVRLAVYSCGETSLIHLDKDMITEVVQREESQNVLQIDATYN